MKEETKRERFIRFLDQTLDKSLTDIKTKFPSSPKKEPLNLKIRIRDLSYSRYAKFDGEYLSISDKPLEKVDCLIYFEKAKIAHRMLMGKILPYSSSLIGKYDIKYYNERSKVFSSIYIPAKNNYCNIIKGTRFTLKDEK